MSVTEHLDPLDGVVAGVDGTDGDAAVLRRAAREARAHALPLRVVRAFSVAGGIRAAGAAFGEVPSLAECAAAIRAEVLAAVGAAGADLGPALTVHVVHGDAPHVLAAAARGADCVVVGHRGRHRLALVLGSVTSAVLLHARCPVVVVPLDEPR